MTFDLVHIIAAVAIILVAGTISGLSGFGFALVAVPPLLVFLEPATVVVVTNLLAVITAWVIIRGQIDKIHFRTLSTCVPGAIVGIFVGLYVLKHADTMLIKLVASSVSICFAIYLASGRSIPGMQTGTASTVAGFASGTLATSTGLSGPPVVVLFHARQIDPVNFRVSLTTYFVITNIAGFLLLLAGNEVHLNALALTVLLIPAAVIGRWLGRNLADRTPPHRFRQITLALLFLTGISGLITAAIALR